MSKKIPVDEKVTVGKLAELLELPASKLVAELFKNGVVATVNESLDFDTAQIIVAELDLGVELEKKEQAAPVARTKRDLSDKAQPRPPVVAFMGHVDHGKTSLLDAIRQAEVVAGEAGGITQHLSAYQITHSDRLVTLLDTPGHEAFAALREHGARLTDVAVIVVAADEGVMSQTIEAIRFIKQAGVKALVALNKVDKSQADINKVKQQLVEHGLNPEDYGGDTVVMPVSAKSKEGLKELLDMIMLVADVEELKAEVDGPAEGIIIESHMEKGRGPVAIALVEQGILRPGEFIQVGDTYGKIRNLESTLGEPIDSAGPSTPAVATGLKALPEFGEQFVVKPSEKAAKEAAATVSQKARSGGTATATTSSELLRVISRSDKLNQLNIIIKADVQGSLTSVIGSLKALDTEEVATSIVSSGIGVINESDIHAAATSKAIIYGFNVTLPTPMKRLAARDGVSIRIYSIIYELIDDVKKELEVLLAPEVIETELAKLIVKGIFKSSKNQTIAGGEVTVGKITLPALARVTRDKSVLAKDLPVGNLKKGPTDVSEVNKGDMCGFVLTTDKKLDIAENDRVEFYNRQTKTRKL